MLLASPQPGVSLRDVITDTCTSDMMKRGVLDASTGGGAAVGGGSLVSGGVRGPSPITAVQKIAVSTKAAPGSVHLVSQLPEASQQGIVAEDKTGGAEGSHDQAYGDAEVTPSVVSSVLASPDAQPSRERERGCLRKRTEAEQERQAHSLAALGQGLKPSESRGFDPKFNLRLIEHATTTAPADREVSVLLAPSEPCSDGGSEGGTNVDVLEVTLQGKDPMTQAPLYTLTCRGGGTAPGEHSNEKKKERGGGGGMVERALTTLKRVMAPLHVDATPVSRLTSSGTDFRRSRTVGLNSLGSKQEERGRRQGVDTPGLSKSKTGVGAFRGNRSVSLLPEGAGGGGGASFLAPASPCFNISLNGGPMIVDGNSPREPAGAPRFDTDATLIFNNLPDRSQGPRRHKRRLFRLLSGKQPANKHRTNLGAPDFELGGGGSCGSRRSFVSSAGSPPTHATPMEGKNYRIVPAAVPLASVLEGQTRLFRRLGTGPAPATADPMDEGHLRSMKEQEAAGGPLAIQRVRTSFSLASSESYFELPMSPRAHDSGEATCSRRKVLRKEREGELYLMIFNACREMYHRLYHKQCIGGSALLSLNTSLDLSNDFAVGKNLTGFEYEWSVLQSRLHCLQYQRSVYCCFWRNIPSAFLRSLLNSGACQSDLEQLLAFVDVHEELLDKGGRNMELLMGKGLLSNYKQQILSAKRFVLYIRDCYPDSFRFAVCKVAATLLLNLKMKLVKDTASKGLVLEEDKEKLLQILDEQQFRLSRFRPCLILIRPHACFSAVPHQENLGAFAPMGSASRPHSPRGSTPEHEV
ncbi:na+ h+ exchanger [Cyclospora cayetanensis]|uniref:Na+ h+ exchanger n=1 Tax=Cyclospora cayetanensis TaxID=88456 RepID=A0A1D3D6L4_9EIME|nr:na+ h+ exchanger [Cyclospora cayetanensis]